MFCENVVQHDQWKCEGFALKENPGQVVVERRAQHYDECSCCVMVSCLFDLQVSLDAGEECLVIDTKGDRYWKVGKNIRVSAARPSAH